MNVRTTEKKKKMSYVSPPSSPFSFFILSSTLNLVTGLVSHLVVLSLNLSVTLPPTPTHPHYPCCYGNCNTEWACVFSLAGDETDIQNKSAGNCTCLWLTQLQPVTSHFYICQKPWRAQMMVSRSDCGEYGCSSCDVTHRLVMGRYDADFTGAGKSKFGQNRGSLGGA